MKQTKSKTIKPVDEMALWKEKYFVIYGAYKELDKKYFRARRMLIVCEALIAMLIYVAVYLLITR